MSRLHVPKEVARPWLFELPEPPEPEPEVDADEEYARLLFEEAEHECH
jgi:hypothetical protein